MLTRRHFASLLAVPLLPARRALKLQAIVAPQLPHSMEAEVPWAPFYELRIYRTSANLAEVLATQGIHPASIQGSGAEQSYLIPFDSLESREQTWQRFGRTPQWIELRRQAELVHVSIYRPSA